MAVIDGRDTERLILQSLGLEDQTNILSVTFRFKAHHAAEVEIVRRASIGEVNPILGYQHTWLSKPYIVRCAGEA